MSHFSSSSEETAVEAELNAPQLLSQYFLVLLGSVDVDPSSSALKVITSAVDTLCEKRIIVRTLLMRIFSNKIVLYNSKDVCCCCFTTSLMDFVVVHKENRQLFGVVTREGFDHRLKCYVFGVDEQLIFHSIHEKYTSKHGITCTISCKSGTNRRSFCDEFPHCALPILEKMRFMLNAPKILIPERVCHFHLTPNDSGISALTVETDDSVYSVTQRFNKTAFYEEKPPSLSYFKRSSNKSNSFIKRNPKSVTDMQNPVSEEPHTASKTEILRMKQLSSERIGNGSDFKIQLVEVSSRQSQRIYGSSKFIRQNSQSQCQKIKEQNKCRILTNRNYYVNGEQSLPSFEDVFTDDGVRSSFRKFLESEVSAENIDFYFMAEFFRERSSNNTMMKHLACEIYNKFFASESMEQVNVDSDVLKEIKAAISSNQISNDLYLSAQNQVRNMLKFDCWPRYIAKIKEERLVVDPKHHRSLLHAWKERFLRSKKTSAENGAVIRGKDLRKDPLLRRTKSFSVAPHSR